MQVSYLQQHEQKISLSPPSTAFQEPGLHQRGCFEHAMQRPPQVVRHLPSYLLAQHVLSLKSPNKLENPRTTPETPRAKEKVSLKGKCKPVGLRFYVLSALSQILPVAQRKTASKQIPPSFLPKSPLGQRLLTETWKPSVLATFAPRWNLLFSASSGHGQRSQLDSFLTRKVRECFCFKVFSQISLQAGKNVFWKKFFTHLGHLWPEGGLFMDSINSACCLTQNRLSDKKKWFQTNYITNYATPNLKKSIITKITSCPVIQATYLNIHLATAHNKEHPL